MKILKLILLIVFLGLYYQGTFAQFTSEKLQADSINKLIAQSDNDSIKAVNYYKISRLYRRKQADSMLHYCTKSNELAIPLRNYRLIYRNNFDIGTALMLKEQNDSAMAWFFKNLEICDSTASPLKCSAYNNHMLAVAYKQKADYRNALEYFYRSLKAKEELGDTAGMINTLLSLGNAGTVTKDSETAISHYKLVIELGEAIKSKKGMAMGYGGMAAVYGDNNEPTIAIKYLRKAIELSDETVGVFTLMDFQNRLGLEYLSNENLDSAEYFFNVSLITGERSGAIAQTKNPLTSLSKLYVKKGEYALALDYVYRAAEVNEANYTFFDDMEIHGLFYDIYKAQGKHQMALENYETYVKMNDSLTHEENIKVITQKETQYEFEKAQLIKEQEEKEAARVLEEKIARRNNLQYSMIFLGILLFFGIVLSLGFIKVSPTVAEGLIFFVFLILFEFLLVLADPFVNQYTGGEPIYNLLANALLAGAIFPAHSFFERTLKSKLLRKS